MNKIRVYRMNEYDCVASKWNIKKTNDWYSKLYDDNEIEDVTEVDLDNEGLWEEIEDTEDIRRKAKDLHSMIRNPKPGDLGLFYGIACRYVTFREAVQHDLNFAEPYIICSTEY